MLHRVYAVLLCGALVLVAGCPKRTSVGVPAAPSPEDAHAVREFEEAVHKYVRLHRRLDATLPALKPTKNLAGIDEHQMELARRISEVRKNARRGEIFTPAASANFRAILAEEFQGPGSAAARKTVNQGEPVKIPNLQVNGTYPEGVPFTTVPPSLLQKLPPLPPEVQFLIVGQNLVLHDVRANIIVDFMAGSIPGRVAH